MGPNEEKDFWSSFETALKNDDGEAARKHLAAGRWITYRDPHLSNQLVREWPNGKKEVIEADLNGNIVVLKSL